MLTQEQGFGLITGVNVYDIVIITQMIEKLLRGGLVTGKELGHVSVLRAKLLGLVKQKFDIDLDNLVEVEHND